MRRWWASRPSRSGCGGPMNGLAGVACAGLLRSPRGRFGGGGRLPAGGAPQAAGRGEVRGDRAGVRAGRVGVSAGRCSRCDLDGEPAVAGRDTGIPGPGARDVDALRRVFATPTPLMAGAERRAIRSRCLPVLFHLLWARAVLRTCRCRCIRHTVAGRPAADDADAGGGAAARRLGASTTVASIRWSRWPARRCGCAQTMARDRWCWPRI